MVNYFRDGCSNTRARARPDTSAELGLVPSKRLPPVTQTILDALLVIDLTRRISSSVAVDSTGFWHSIRENTVDAGAMLLSVTSSMASRVTGRPVTSERFPMTASLNLLRPRSITMKLWSLKAVCFTSKRCAGQDDVSHMFRKRALNEVQL